MSHYLRIILLVSALGLILSSPAAQAQETNTWQVTPLWGGWGNAVAFSPNYALDQTLFVGMRKGGLFRSLDGGQTFTISMADDLGLEIFAIAPSPTYATDNTVFAATRGGIWRSQDKGATWQHVYTAAGAYFWHIAPSPNFATDGLVMAVASDDRSEGLGVLRSTSHGDPDTWRQSNTGISALQGTAIAIAPEDPNIAFYGAYASIYRSTNGGASWSPATLTGAMQGSVHDLEVSPHFTRDGHVYAGVGQYNNTTLQGAYVWKSTNGGTSFSKLPMTGGQGNSDYRTVALAPDYDGSDQVPDIVYAGRPSWSTFRSEDGGNSWRMMNFPEVDGSRVLPDTYDIAIAPTFNSTISNTQTIASAVHGTGLFMSHDGGFTWQVANTGLYGHWMNSVKVADDGTIFATISGNGVVRSDDGGRTWLVRNDDVADRRLGMHSAHAIATSPNFALTQRLITGNSFGEWEKILYSTDGGVNWLPATNTGGCEQSYDAIFRDTIVAYLATQSGICRTRDGGNTWTKIALTGVPVRTIVISPGVVADGTLFAGTTGNGVYRSVDGGDSWQPSGLGGLQVRQLAISPAYLDDGTIFAGVENSGVWRSTNRGATWTRQALGGEKVRGVAISPTYSRDKTVWAATSIGDIYQSTDGGETWTPTDFHVGEPSRVWLVANPQPGGAALFAATEGRGLWQWGQSPTCSLPQDIDADGQIGARDVMLAAQGWRHGPGDTAYDSRFDLLADGAIGLFDVMLISSIFDSSCR